MDSMSLLEMDAKDIIHYMRGNKILISDENYKTSINTSLKDLCRNYWTSISPDQRRKFDILANKDQTPQSLKEEIIRETAKQILQRRYRFSKDQVDTLLSIQKSLQHENKTINIVSSNQTSQSLKKETIKEMTQ
ncbi:hypothetical protein Glove_180g106 [Diversispora epigaea]|uniref:Uncharacterized protein n=1 Tax=Diversispora epigaea TaxID=1348612 RepID=A0A397IXI6_9GLOM|nr:hypothetical protein Glove_180g106 [Diversispora epigaea]